MINTDTRLILIYNIIGFTILIFTRAPAIAIMDLVFNLMLFNDILKDKA